MFKKLLVAVAALVVVLGFAVAVTKVKTEEGTDAAQ